MLAAGEELATAASQALGVEMKFENISEYVLLTFTSPFPHFPSLARPPPPYTHSSFTHSPVAPHKVFSFSHPHATPH